LEKELKHIGCENCEMSSSESAPTPHKSDTSSSVPTDLTVSSSSSSAAGAQNGLQAENRRLAQQVALLEIEGRKASARAEAESREMERRVLQAEQERVEAVAARTLAENSVELRLAVQAKEMGRIQTAINAQLSDVIDRQQNLEKTNMKLREGTHEVKTRLEEFSYSEDRYRALLAIRWEDMGLHESAEMLIYRSLIPEKKKNAELQLKVSELESQILKQSEVLERAQVQIVRREEELTEKEKNIADIRTSVQELDILNNALQRRLEVFEQEKVRDQGDASRKEAELLSYKQRQERLQNDLMNTSMENRSLSGELALVRREVESLRGICQGAGDRSEEGISSLAQLTRNMQSRQAGLLEQLSTSVLQGNLDRKYREQYLESLKELVTEQVRSQKYISRLTSEKESLGQEANRLEGQVTSLQMDLVELEVRRAREAEKTICLETELRRLQAEQQRTSREEKEKTATLVEKKDEQFERKTEAMVPEREYRAVLQDLELLLSHREEIEKIQTFVAELQSAGVEGRIL